MNILDLKRSLLPLKGYRWEDSPGDSTAGNGYGAEADSDSGRGSSGSGGFGMFGVSYANPSLEQMTISPETSLSPAAKQAARDVIGGVLSGKISQDQVTQALSEKGLSTKAGGIIGGILGGLVAGTLGGIAGKKAGEALATDDPVSGLMSLAAEVNAGKYGKEAKTQFSGFANQGSGNNTTTTQEGGSSGANSTQTAAEATAAANKDPATLATSIANQSWNDWQGDKAALQTQVATNTQRGNALYDSAAGAANGNMKLVSGMQSDYNNIFRPAGEQYATYVGMLGSQGYQDQQAGQAVADVQQQTDMQMGAAQRNLQRSGVDPSSGRMLAMSNQNAIGTAAAKAGAANTSRRNTMADWSAGLTKMSDMGNNTLSAAKGLDSSAQSWNTLGMNAGSTGFSQGSDLSKLSGFNASTSGGVAGTAANAIYGQGQLANANANTKIAEEKANPWTTIGGAVITNAAKGIDWTNIFS